MRTIFVGVDVGGTTTKAVAFDLEGTVLTQAERRGEALSKGGGRVERDMDDVWALAAEAIRECCHSLDAGDIAAVSVVGHSDGLYPIDDAGRPVAAAIQATDTRAASIAGSYHGSSAGQIIGATTGTLPFAGSPAALCHWLLADRPDALEEARWLLFAKDWIRYRLTGEIATDPTDASASFLDVNTRAYSSEALALYELDGISSLLPEIMPSTALAGGVADDAACVTGLRPGTPVVVGCHDVDAAAIGLGAFRLGDLSIAAGTFSINQLLVDEVKWSEKWQVRVFVEPDRWLAMSTSPTSASNLTWFSGIASPGMGEGIADLEREVADVAGDPSEVTFLPYVFGAPDSDAGASFFGMRSHHIRGHLTRAVLEGVIFSHRLHLNWLGEAYALPDVAAVTGGATRSSVWMQMLADGLGLTVRAGDGLDTARGAAMLAAVGAGAHPSLTSAASAMVPVKKVYEPRSSEMERLDDAYQQFLHVRELAGEVG